MSSLEKVTVGWLVCLVCTPLLVLFAPDLPKDKSWFDVLGLVVSALAALFSAGAGVIALYIAWNQRQDQAVQAHTAMVIAASALQYKLESLIEACDTHDSLSLKTRFGALEKVDRQLQAVRGELLKELSHMEALIRLRDVSTEAVGLVREALDKRVPGPTKLRVQFVELRRLGYEARWKLLPAGNAPPPLPTIPLPVGPDGMHMPKSFW